MLHRLKQADAHVIDLGLKRKCCETLNLRGGGDRGAVNGEGETGGEPVREGKAMWSFGGGLNDKVIKRGAPGLTPGAHQK